MQGSYRVQVKGIRDGAFRLTVAVALGGQTTTFDYGPVPVKLGTVAEVRIVPNLIGADLPPLEVTTDGNKSMVAAQSGPGMPQSPAGDSPTLPDTPIPGSQPPASAGDSGATQTNGLSTLVVLAACLTALAGVGLLVLGITIMVRHKRRLPI